VAPSPEPVVIDESPDYVLDDTEQLLANVEGQLRGLAIGEFFERAYRITAGRDPERVIADGLVAEFGLANPGLTDISDEYYFQTVAVQKLLVELAQEFDPVSLSPGDRLSRQVFLAFLNLEIEWSEYRDFQYPATYGFWGWPGNTEVFFFELAPVNNLSDAENYLELLIQVGRRFRQIGTLLDARVAAGVREPRVTFDYSRSLMENLSKTTARNSDHYKEFNDKLSLLDNVTDVEQSELLERLLLIIEQIVQPAYAELEQKMAALLPEAPENIGFGQFEGGQAFYKFALRFYTSGSETPEQIHQLGLSELARIHAEMQLLFDQLGYPRDESLAQLLGRVDADGGSVVGREAVAFFEDIIDEAYADLSATFSTLPVAEVVVIGGDSGGFYIKASSDGSRPGAFYAQTNTDLPYTTMPTLAYHEAIPGHHLQIALAQELDLPRFRRNSTFTSFVEGWGLYAERLAKDLGWYESDPYGDLGRLRFEAMRAARLVLDTGIHSKGWTYEQAQQFNRENVGNNGAIARYSVSPGQASAYTTGMLKILALRQQAQDELDGLYDIRDFHAAVIGNGSMPLNILEEVVNDYITEKLAAADQGQ
jgi:uncharacterized protein (DUF885 family)